MESEFLTIQEISEYLHIKPATLYAKVESGDLPYYKVGKLIRFKLKDVERWMEGHRRDTSGVERKAKAILRATNKSNLAVDEVVKKAIEEVKRNVYTPEQGEPN